MSSSSSTEVALYDAAQGKEGKLRMGSSGEKEAITMLIEQIKELIENGGMFWAASSFLYSYIAKGQGGTELRRNATIGMGAIALFKVWRMAQAHLYTTVVIPQDLADQSDLYRYARELLQHNGSGDSGLTLAERGNSVPMKMVSPAGGFQSTAFELKPWRKSDSQMFVWRGPFSHRLNLADELAAINASEKLSDSPETFLRKAASFLRKSIAVGLALDIGRLLPQEWADMDKADEIHVSSSQMKNLKCGTFLRLGQEILQVWRVAPPSPSSPTTQTISVFRAQQNTEGLHHEKNTQILCLSKSSWLEAAVKRCFGSVGPGKLLWISEDVASVPGGSDKKDAATRRHQQWPKQSSPADWPYGGYGGYGGVGAGKGQAQSEQGLVVTVLGRDLAWLKEMLAEGKKVYDKNAEGHLVTLYRPESFTNKKDPYAWEYGSQTPIPDTWADKRVAGRPLGSVILPRVHGKGREEDLRDDVARFFSPEEEKFYRARGMPHRRGYLLHGVPGSGKTSVIKAIACDLNLPIFQMSLNMEGMNDCVFMKLMDKVPARSIILFEDIDAAKTSVDRTLEGAGEPAPKQAPPKKQPQPDIFSELEGAGAIPGRRSRRGGTGGGDAGEGGVKLDTLLNALDGLNAQENRVVFMTTNHKEKLDAALIRPGRIDVQVEFCYVSPEQAARYFVRFFSHLVGAGDSSGCVQAEASPQLQAAAAVFGKHVEGLSHYGVPIGLSVCELQQYLMEHRASFEEAAAAGSVELRRKLLEKYFKLRFKSAQQKQQEIVRSTEHNAAVFAKSVAPGSDADMLQAVRFLDQHKTQAEALAHLKDLLDATPTLAPSLGPQIAISG